MSFPVHVSVITPVVLLLAFIVFRMLAGHAWIERHRLHMQVLVLGSCILIAGWKFYRKGSVAGMLAAGLAAVATVKFAVDARRG